MKLAGGSLDDMLEESERRMILDALGKAGACRRGRPRSSGSRSGASGTG